LLPGLRQNHQSIQLHQTWGVFGEIRMQRRVGPGSKRE